MLCRTPHYPKNWTPVIQRPDSRARSFIVKSTPVKRKAMEMKYGQGEAASIWRTQGFLKRLEMREKIFKERQEEGSDEEASWGYLFVAWAGVFGAPAGDREGTWVSLQLVHLFQLRTGWSAPTYWHIYLCRVNLCFGRHMHIHVEQSASSQDSQNHCVPE